MAGTKTPKKKTAQTEEKMEDVGEKPSEIPVDVPEGKMESFSGDVTGRKMELAGGNRSGPLGDETKKKMVLSVLFNALARTNIISASCRAAGISHTTFHNWVNDGSITPKDLENCAEQYKDYLREEIAKVGLVGVATPMVRNGRIVYDNDGQEVTEYKRDMRVLMKMAEKFLPEYREDNKTIVVQNAYDIPDEFCVVFDLRLLTADEAGLLLDVAAAVADRRVGVVAAGA